MGYVYIMEVPSLNACKIGISEHSVEKRQQTIQTSCPGKIERVWCSRNIPDYRLCERKLHEIFSEQRTNGEWFNVDFTKACVQADKITSRYNETECQAMGDMYYKKVNMTKELADRYLATSQTNRTLRKEKINKLIKDIVNGEWDCNHQSIAIDSDGVLIDGHHRLTAISETGIACPVWVAFNAHRSTKIDVGASRSDNDSLFMAGEIGEDHTLRNKLGLPLVTYMIARALGENVSKTSCASFKKYIYEQFSDDIDFVVNTASRFHNSKAKLRSAPILYAMLCARRAGVPDNILSSWFGIAATGDFYIEGDDVLTKAGRSINLFRDYVTFRDRSSTYVGKEEVLKKAMSSIRHYATRKSITKLYGELVYPDIIIQSEALAEAV